MLCAVRLVHLEVQQKPGQAVHSDIGHDSEGISGGESTTSG